VHARASRQAADSVHLRARGRCRPAYGHRADHLDADPPELATDTATVDAAARHAIESWESRQRAVVGIVALLYGNIPIRAEGLIDRAIELLVKTKADSVRSVARVTKQHPDWLHRLDGDRMSQYRVNSIYRRQDLEPLFYHDGAVAAVTRRSLFDALKTPDDHQAFLGRERRALVQRPEDAVDVDEPIDLRVAEAILRSRSMPDGVSV
jgi:CMP-N-acetylneuraminic acid synthetase